RGGDFEVDMDLVVGEHEPPTLVPVDHAASCEQRHVGMDTLEIAADPPGNFSNAKRPRPCHCADDLEPLWRQYLVHQLPGLEADLRGGIRLAALPGTAEIGEGRIQGLYVKHDCFHRTTFSRPS